MLSLNCVCTNKTQILIFFDEFRNVDEEGSKVFNYERK